MLQTAYWLKWPKCKYPKKCGPDVSILAGPLSKTDCNYCLLGENWDAITKKPSLCVTVYKSRYYGRNNNSPVTWTLRDACHVCLGQPLELDSPENRRAGSQTVLGSSGRRWVRRSWTWSLGSCAPVWCCCPRCDYTPKSQSLTKSQKSQLSLGVKPRCKQTAEMLSIYSIRFCTARL